MTNSTRKITFDKRSIIIFLVFSLSVFLQIMFFHVTYFHSILLSSALKNPLSFISFYLPKIGITFLLASFCFILRSRKSKMIGLTIISLLIDVWIVAELIYIRANHVPLDSYTITMVDNMEGFWSSVFLYIEATDFILLLITACLFTFLFFYKNTKTTWSQALSLFALTFITSLIINIGSCLLNWWIFSSEHEKMLKEAHEQDYDDIFPPGANGQRLDVFISPFSFEMESVLYGNSDHYIYDYSIIHSFIFCTKGLIWQKMDNIELNSIDNHLFEAYNSVSSPKTKLIVCLIESWESWSLENYVMPNMYKLANHNNVLYCNKVISQARRGTSADGQMIVETGLLPINGGAVCYRYYDNTFPSLSSIYGKDNSVGLFPHPLSVWNQDKMGVAYNIGQSYTCEDNDTILFKKASQLIEKHENLLFITSSTHSPFVKINDKSSLQIPNDMPKYMRNYLKSFNYFDDCVETFLEMIDCDSTLKNATIVFTGDHTVFQNEKRVEFKKYCDKNPQYKYNVEDAYCPLIIYSPLIHGNIKIKEEVYQMDIFTTILNVIGCEDYSWKGFGVNLLDSVSISNRRTTETSAFELSDKIIRSNFFKDFKSAVQPKQTYQ